MFIYQLPCLTNSYKYFEILKALNDYLFINRTKNKFLTDFKQQTEKTVKLLIF